MGVVIPFFRRRAVMSAVEGAADAYRPRDRKGVEMRTLTVAMEHLRMTSWNVAVVVSLLLLLLLASLLVTRQVPSENIVNDPQPAQGGSPTTMQGNTSAIHWEGTGVSRL